MVASLYQPCGPRPASSNAARWYFPCLGKLFIGQFIGGYQKGHFIYWTGTAVRSWMTSAGAPTSCYATGAYAAYHYTAGAYLGASVDIWAARRAGIWSSSTVFEVDCDGREEYDSGNTTLRVGIIKPDDSKVNMISLAKTVNQVAPDCTIGGAPLVRFYVTVYDDGTYAIS